MTPRSFAGCRRRPPGADFRHLPPQDMFWEVDEWGVYLVLGGRRYRARNTAILANGTRDIVIVEDRGELKLASVNHSFDGRVLHMPSGDLAVFEFTERLPAPYMMSYLILEIDAKLEPLIREICRRWPMARHEDYDAHLGGDYWRRS